MVSLGLGSGKDNWNVFSQLCLSVLADAEDAHDLSLGREAVCVQHLREGAVPGAQPACTHGHPPQQQVRPATRLS